MTPGSRVPAVGGERDVPAPDPIAAAYLELALRLDQRIPGLVDGYYGPAAIKARVDTEQLRAPGRLVADAIELAGRLEPRGRRPRPARMARASRSTRSRRTPGSLPARPSATWTR